VLMTQLSFYLRFMQIGVSTLGNNGTMFVTDGTHVAAGFAQLTGTTNANTYAL
jgi:hypothetical protein